MSENKAVFSCSNCGKIPLMSIVNDDIPKIHYLCNFCLKDTTVKIKEFLDKNCNSKEKHQCSRCNQHDAKKEGKMFCLQCQKWFCDNCLEMHNEFSIDHIVVPCEIKIETKCNKHNNKDIEFFCEECRKNICLFCLDEEHQKHKVSKLKTVYNNSRFFEFKEDLAKAQEKVRQYNKDIKDRLVDVLNQKIIELNNEVESVENAYKENNIINEELLQMVEILYYNYKLTDKCPNYYIMMNLLNNSTFNLSKCDYNINQTPEENRQILINYYKSDFIFPKAKHDLSTLECLNTSEEDPMKINQLQNLSIASKQYNDKRSSLFFTEIFNSIKNTSNNDEKNKQIAREKFDSLKDYLFNLNDFKNFQKQKNNDLLGIILSTIKERSVLTKEFNFLKEYFHKTDVDTAEVENKMFLLASKYKIQSTLVALSFFLKQFPKCYRKTDFSDMLIQKSNELDKSREIDFVMIEDISSQLKSIDIDIENQKDFIKILLEIRGRDDFFKFLENKTDNDFRNLPEFAGEVDDNTATANDIQDLINVVNFVNDLKGIRNVTDKEFIAQYNNLFNEHRYSNIAVNFSQVIKNFFSLKDLYLKVTNKSLIYKNVIKDLIKESKFDITKKKKDCYSSL